MPLRWGRDGTAGETRGKVQSEQLPLPLLRERQGADWGWGGQSHHLHWDPSGEFVVKALHQLSHLDPSRPRSHSETRVTVKPGSLPPYAVQ